MKFKPLANPIMIVSDNPSYPTGLARSGLDIASLLCTLPQFRVAYLGRGIGQRRHFPFILYDFPESGQWGEEYIEQAWHDFAGEDNGIIFTTDDPSRRHWFANPLGMPEGTRKFLGDGRNFLKWGYFPLDSTGPNGQTLSVASQDCISHYDRVLGSSEWARNVMVKSGKGDADWLPHGIHPELFHINNSEHLSWPKRPFEKLDAEAVGWDCQDIHVGCVMANQSRKDYPAAFECFAHLKHHYGNRFKAWLHTDAMLRYWNAYALATEYGVGDCLEVTLGLTDSELCLRYNACDCTILPSAGEGFGFPIAESLACGTAAVVTDYAGGQEIVEESCRVDPVAFRVDTQHCVLRAVLSGRAFANKAIEQVDLKRQDWEYRAGQLADTVSHLLWPNLKHLWTRWLLDGLK